MPIDPDSGTFARIWQFVDHFAQGDDINRSDLDAALDDFVPAINAALLVVASAAASAAAAAASATAASTIGGTAGAAAGAAAAEAAAAVHIAAMAAAVSAVEDILETVEGIAEDLNPEGFLSLSQTTAYTGDLNSLAATGLQKLGSGVTNGPTGAGVGDFILTVYHDANTATQLALNNGATALLSIRARSSGTWGAWVDAVLTAGDQTVAGSKTFSAATTFSADLSLKGAASASVDDGTLSSGTYTPSPVGGNFRHIINGGAFTLAPPAASGAYTLVIEMVNGASAGALTTSAFLRVTGDPLTTTNGHKFQMVIVKSPAGSTLNVTALQ